MNKERTKEHTFQPKLYKSKVNPNKELNYQVYRRQPKTERQVEETMIENT